MHTLVSLCEADDVASLIALRLDPSNWIAEQVAGVNGRIGSVRSRT